MKKIIRTDKAPAPIGPYSQAVDAGSLVFFSGQIPLDAKTGDVVKGGVKEQAEKVMENISALLTAADLTFNHLVKTTIYLTDMNDFGAVNEVYGKHVSKEPPARTTIAVAALPKGVKVEIEVLAQR